MFRGLRFALALLVAVAACAAAATSASAFPSSSLHVFSVDDFRIGGHAFLGKTVTQVTNAFGRPTRRVWDHRHRRPGWYVLRYGRWTIAFKRRARDGKLLAWTARSTDPLLTGTHGNRVLSPWLGGAGIQHRLGLEAGGFHNPGGNEWILRTPYSRVTHRGAIEDANFPRAIVWGIGRTHWLRLKTDLNIEFPAP